MCDSNPREIGAIGWIDLTVTDAGAVKDFYARVVGWKNEPLNMGEYDDFVMKTFDTGRPMAGICHALGANAAMPPVWLPYITIEDLDAAMYRCVQHGGEIVAPPRGIEGHGRFCVIRDPAGAFAALFEPDHDPEHQHDP